VGPNGRAWLETRQTFADRSALDQDTTSPIEMMNKSHIKSGNGLGSLSPAIGEIKFSTVRAISLAAAQFGITSSSDIRVRTRREWMEPLPAWRTA